MQVFDTDKISSPDHINWFPGHMHKALREVRQKIKAVDLALEIRDARAPLASSNCRIEQLLGQKPRLIILNKSKLAESENIQQWRTWFYQKEQPFVFTDAFDRNCASLIKNEVKKLMKRKMTSFKKKGIKPPPIRMMVLGIPNTGKSTIINRLTQRSATRTGSKPGVTRGLEWIVLGKRMELLDTPGIMPPTIDSEERGLWLCALHAIKDEIVDETKVASLILKALIDKNPDAIRKRYKVDPVVSEIEILLREIGVGMKYIKKKGVIDIQKASRRILHDFRQGLLGACSFESPPTASDTSVLCSK